MLEIIADIGHDKQIVRRHDPAEAQRELAPPMPPDRATTRSRLIETDPHLANE